MKNLPIATLAFVAGTDQRQLFFPSATIGFTGYDSHGVSPWEGPPRGSKIYRTFLWLFWAASMR